MSLIEVNNLTKIFYPNSRSNISNSVNALTNVSFKLEPGDCLGIIGKNGAGKTTLLRILSSILKPSSGEAIIRGKVNSLIQLGSGFHPDLTGLENIKLLLKISGENKTGLNNKIDEIISFSEIEYAINNQLKSYSSGMYLKLAFSVYAHIKSDLLLIDEILSVGDANFLRKSFEKILNLKKEGVTFIIASHDIDRLEYLCNKGIYLEQGSVSLLGSYSDVYNKYVFDINKKPSNIKTGSLFDNDKFSLFKVSFSNCKNYQNGIAVYYYEEEIEIRFDFELKKEISGFDFGINVSNGYSPIFFDSPLLNIHSKSEIKPGKYYRFCKIPKNFLFSGFFEISVWAGTNSYDEIIIKNYLAFNVKNHNNLTIKSLGHVKHPILQKLSWSLEKNSKVDYNKQP